jgi:hypothetical protein
MNLQGINERKKRKIFTYIKTHLQLTLTTHSQSRKRNDNNGLFIEDRKESKYVPISPCTGGGITARSLSGSFWWCIFASSKVIFPA